MNIHEQTRVLLNNSKTLDYWKSVREHPLSRVIPNLDLITRSQWSFWRDRLLVVQADLALGEEIIDIVNGETIEKKEEIIKLQHGESTPVQVAMEAADELVFLNVLVGMHPNNWELWERVSDSALAVAHGALDTIVQMEKLARRRMETSDAAMLSSVGSFVSQHVIGRKNISNYPPMFFVPVPEFKGKRRSATLVSNKDIVYIYDKARSGARGVRTTIKNSMLYTAHGIPPAISQFARHNGTTPEPHRSDPSIQVLQASVAEHFRTYAGVFGEVGVAHLIRFFVQNDPDMVDVVSSSLSQRD